MKRFFVPVLCVILAGCISSPEKIIYPTTRMDDTVDNYYGTKVADPYRWLEDQDSAETTAWIEAQNNLTFSYMDRIPEREKIRARLTELWNYPTYSTPRKEGGRYFFFKNDGLQNQAVLYMQKTPYSEPAVVIDPNTFSDDGTIALVNLAFNKNGTLLAYGVSHSGSDWQEVRAMEVDSGRSYDDVIEWCRSSLSWSGDKGFFYSRYPEPGTVAEEDQFSYNRLYWHELGTPQSADRLVYERPDAKELSFGPYVTEDGKYLIIRVSNGTEMKNRVYYREIRGGEVIRLLDDADALYSFIDNIGPVFYFRTDLNAPNGRIIAIDVRNPERKVEIIPQQRDAISFAITVNNRFLVAYIHDAHHQLKLYDLDGNFLEDIELPGIGSIAGLSGSREDDEMFLSFTSFLHPATIFRYDFKGGELKEFRGPEIDFDPSGYETEQVFYSSKDGTKVPMFITHKKGIELNSENPTLLYGYGGFGSGFMPSFSASRLLWLENGGVYAVANLRGGNEYGEAWHQAGMLDKKQNVFDDFIAAAEWLIKNRYTSTSKLAIQGGSNGGLLVAACMVQRPELFGSVICQVPLTDMLRYQRFTIGRYWISEYGNAEANPEEFRTLYAYSPLHNVKDVSYPATLITTADHDDRVAPAHAEKFASALQAANKGNNPILLRLETKAGHGGGKPMTKVIEEQSDIYAFLFKTLHINMEA